MSISSIYSGMNKQYSLSDYVTLTEIKTEEDKKKANQNHYPVGFTQEEWEKKYPAIPADKVICPKSGPFPSSLAYYDHKGIFITLNIFGDQLLDIPGRDEPFDVALSKHIQELEEVRDKKNYKKLLVGSASEGSGNIAAQLILDLLENYGPSPELYEAFISFYTFGDCGCGVLTDNMDKFMELLNGRTDAQRKAAMTTMKDLPDVVTVYRGEGNESTPYEKAVSWTLNLTAAYFFAAWRCPATARVIKGTVHKEELLAYITDRHEEEVMVVPGTVENIEIHDCVTIDDFQDKIVQHPAELRNAYEAFYYNISDIYTEIDDAAESYVSWNDHDKKHVQDVTFIADYLYRVNVVEPNLKATNKEIEAIAETFNSLIRAAIWHDAGRTDEEINSKHGADSYRIWMEETGEDDDDVAEFLMTYHCKENAEAKAFFDEKFAERQYSQYIWDALCALKDADAIDRWRFGWGSSDFVDATQLRSQASKDLMLVGAVIQYAKFS